MTILLLFLLLLLPPPLASPSLIPSPSPALRYHHGPLLSGNLSLRLIWYGRFSSSQRSAVTDFLLSLSSPLPAPSVSSWWSSTRLFLPHPLSLSLSLSPHQLLLSSYPIGRSLSLSLPSLLPLITNSSTNSSSNTIPILLTSSDVSFTGFCSSRCGTHSPLQGYAGLILVGDPSLQCPGLCAWPFHQPLYGPQSPPLAAPTGDLAADAIVIALATLLAGAVTNPDGRGFFQGPPSAPLEAVSACAGIFGTGAYPGFPGNLLLDPTTGASYNARGINGRKYLLPAMWDPTTSHCATLV